MIEVVVLIPLYYNDGSKIEKEIIQEIEENWIIKFGGFTDTGRVRGKWKGGDGQIYRDISRRYEIAINPADIEKFKQTVIEAGRKTKQLAMYIKIDGVPDILEVK